jgi:hypothetical protein
VWGELDTAGRVAALRDRQNDVLRFTTDLRIPPTSNQAERDLRPAKTQQKISGRLRSEETTRHQYAIRGYISTAARHRASVLTALLDADAARPRAAISRARGPCQHVPQVRVPARWISCSHAASIEMRVTGMASTAAHRRHPNVRTE